MIKTDKTSASEEAKPQKEKMIEYPETVVYYPPKGVAHGHATRPRNLPGCVPAINAFLKKHTVTFPPQFISMSMTYSSEWDHAEAAESCLDKVIAEFGLPLCGEVKNAADMFNREVKWDFDVDDLPQVVDFMVAGHPWPKQPCGGPVTFTYWQDFYWRDKTTGKPISEQLQGHETQDGSLKSNFIVHLSRNPFIQPTLHFPYPVSDERFYSLLSDIATDLPFKASPKNFRISPAGKGKAHKHRKLDAAALKRIKSILE